MNRGKTEYLRIGEEQEDPDVQLRELKKCEEYKYLGSMISSEGTSNDDIRYRVQQGQKCVRIFNSLLWSNHIKINTKMTIYRAIVEPILTYGSECWQLSGRNRKRVETVEMDYIRRASRVSRLERIPNQEIRRRVKRTYTTIDRIETRQLLWYGHVMRMEENRWPKKAMKYVPANRRKRGRPALTWINGITEIMRDRAIDEEEWRNRERWRSKCGMRQRL